MTDKAKLFTYEDMRRSFQEGVDVGRAAGREDLMREIRAWIGVPEKPKEPGDLHDDDDKA